MPKRPSHRASLIAGIVAAILIIGAVASNVIASDLQRIPQPYSHWVWLMVVSLALNQLGEHTRAINHAEQALIIRQPIEDPGAARVCAKLSAWRAQTDA